MTLNNAKPPGNARTVLQDNINAAFKNVRDATTKAAANAGAGIQKIYNNPWSGYDKAKNDVKDATGDIDIAPMPLPTKISRQIQLHWNMLVPMFTAMTILLATTHCLMNDASISGDGRLASLIPLFMIMGEPILSKALAVCTASPRQDSPHFGCGWLSWSLSTVVTAFSSTRDLVAKPEVVCKVINLKSGQVRDNNSFVLSRVLRDLESEYAPNTSGLTIEVLDAGKPEKPLSWSQTFRINCVSTAIMIIQLAIGILAFIQNRDIYVVMIFSAALFLMEAIANMPAWKAHKFSARKDGGKNATYALMRGNGHQHVFVIRNVHAEAWDLEDLAGAAVSRYDYSSTLEDATLCCALLSFAALTCLTTMLPDRSTFAVLYILALGTFGNILTVASPRKPWMHGISLRSIEVISNDREVIVALRTLEEKYAGIGATLVKEFFPGGLRGDEEAWWNERKEVQEQKMATKKAETAQEVADIKEEIMKKYDVRDVSAGELEKEIEKMIRGQ